MALMHFQHKHIGKSTHAARVASSNVHYITRMEEAGPERGARSQQAEAVDYHTRTSAAGWVGAARMPEEKNAAARWLDAAAADDRANARVCDTFIVALPRELSKEQRIELVRDWCEDATKGKAAWFAAIHDKGKDEANPHAHIIIRDRDYSKEYASEKQRPRVMGTSTGKKEIESALRRGVEPPPRVTTYELRASWAEHTNRALERAGVKQRVDPRSYKEQGIDKQAGVHEGRAARRMEQRGERPESRVKEQAARSVAYNLIDEGRTRPEENRERRRRELELERGQAIAQTTGQPSRQAQRQALRDTQDLEQQSQHRQQRRAQWARQKAEGSALRALTAAELAQHKQLAGDLVAEARSQAFADIGVQFGEKWEAVSRIADAQQRTAAIAQLKTEQAAAYKRHADELVGHAKDAQAATWRALTARHQAARKGLLAQQRGETSGLASTQAAERQAVRERRKAIHAQEQAHVAAARDSAALSRRGGLAGAERVQMRRMRERAEDTPAKENTDSVQRKRSRMQELSDAAREAQERAGKTQETKGKDRSGRER